MIFLLQYLKRRTVMHTLSKLLLVIALFVLGGCGMSELSYRNNTLTAQVDKKYLNISGQTLYRHKDSFGNLYLTQEMIRLRNGEQIAYEKVTLDPLYEFNLIPLQTIQVLFNTKSINQIYFKSSFYLLQLTLQDGRVLNMVLNLFDDQTMSYAYGMSTSSLKKMLKELNPQARPGPMAESVVTIPKNSHIFLSHWSVQIVQLTPLLTPLRYLGGYR